MKRTLSYIFSLALLIGLTGCVEKYDFNVESQSEGIVIESMISDRSYNATRLYPSEGRYFQVRLAKTSSVDNVRDEAISNAKVELLSSDGDSWFYFENVESPGTYNLNNSFFAANPTVQYKVRVTLENFMVFESTWEQMPIQGTDVGEISTKETSVDKYEYFKTDERRLVTERGLDLYTKLPKNDSDAKRYYRWTYEPLWVYNAPLASSQSLVKQCWANSPYYLAQFTVAEDIEGAYDQKLTFIKAKDNHRMIDYFSILTVQTAMTEGYYYFWKDLQAQGKKGGLFDQPPFGLPTNFSSSNSDWSVSGYFGVVAEAAERWVFDDRMVSYVPFSNIADICINPPKDFDLGPECFDCREYHLGDATINPPWWW